MGLCSPGTHGLATNDDVRPNSELLEGAWLCQRETWTRCGFHTRSSDGVTLNGWAGPLSCPFDHSPRLVSSIASWTILYIWV
jgi:hypothetical protein